MGRWPEAARIEAAANRRLPVERIADRLIGSINDDASARDDRALVVVRVPDGIGGGARTEREAEQVDETSHEPAERPMTGDAGPGHLVAGSG